jgi:hypothetical protein
MALLDQFERGAHFLAQLRRLERDCASVLAQDPGRKQAERGVSRAENSILQVAGAAEGALDPPGRLAPDADVRLAH